MAKKKHHKNNQGVAYVEVEKDFGMWKNYMQYGLQYDTVNDCPLIPGETRIVEQLSSIEPFQTVWFSGYIF